jgi:hypothetical protein
MTYKTLSQMLTVLTIEQMNWMVRLTSIARNQRIGGIADEMTYVKFHFDRLDFVFPCETQAGH